MKTKIPCGRVLGHNEYCDKHGMCGQCIRIKQLEKTLIEIRDSTYRSAIQLRAMAHDALEK